MLAVAEREMSEGETGWGQSEERDVTQFLTVCEVQFTKTRAERSLHDMPHTEIRHPGRERGVKPSQLSPVQCIESVMWRCTISVYESKNVDTSNLTYI